MPSSVEIVSGEEDFFKILNVFLLFRNYLPFEKTRNTVSNAHKMIPPASPCFVWQSPCFALGNPKIMRIK